MPDARKADPIIKYMYGNLICNIKPRYSLKPVADPSRHQPPVIYKPKT